MTSDKSSNPNPRSSEISNPMRRSFTGNPFANKPSVIANPRSNFPNTPVNSPSDFPRRSSVGIRESVGSLRDFMDDKENGKDQILKPAKVRSPAAASSKGTKNFMSPTISASCKVNESPRKKVLVERNEAVSSSADTKGPVRKVTFAEPLEEKKHDALFDGITPNFEDVPRSSLTSEDFSGESETSVNDMNVPLIPNNDTDLSFETVNYVNMNVPLVLENDIHTETIAEEPDCVNLDPTFKLSPTATPPVSMKATILAPLDADPLMPPYDPKTNYLSPRPQFLHYKPKPRTELFIERELEDSFISGSFSDTEVTEDAQSDGSQKESDVVSSTEIVKEEEGQISEPSPTRRTLKPEEAVEAKVAPKPRFAVRAKAIALILLLSVAFVSISSVTDPVIDQTVFENFFKVYESSEFSGFATANFDKFSHFAKARFDELARNLHTWFAKSLSSISEFISDIRGVHSLAKLQYYNLTVLDDYTMVDQYPIFGHGENEIDNTHAPVWSAQESDAASGTDNDVYIDEDISEGHYEVYEEQVQKDIEAITGVEHASAAPESEEVLEGQPATMIESEQALQLAEAVNSETTQPQEGERNLNVENQPNLNSEFAEISTEAYGTSDIDTKQAHENDAKFTVEEQGDISLDSEVAEFDTAVSDDKAEGKVASIEAALRGNEQRLEAINIPSQMVLYLLLLAGTVLVGGAAFNWSRKGTSRSEKVITSSVEQPVFDKEFHNSSPVQNKQKGSPDKASMRNGPIEMDMLGEPCPSEMSSFQESSYYSKKVVKQLNDETAHSQEKKRKHNYRRESLASSSSDYSMMSSPSYGSLTVYEKIPSKLGHGDEENIITPVRRSSRIRNLATSPS